MKLQRSAMDIDTINKDFYNSSADSFDKIPFESLLPQMIQKYHQGKTVLDIGSGPGTLAAWMASKGYEVVCIEPAAKPAAKAKEKGLTVHCVTIEEFEIDQHYDTILAISSLIHVPKEQLPSQIQKIASLLNPNGIFFVSLIIGSGEGLEDPTNLGKMRYFAHWLSHELDTLFSPFFTLLEEHQVQQKKMHRYFTLRAYRLKSSHS